MSYNQWNGDIGIATLEPQPIFPELYCPIWLYSGNNSGFNTTEYVQKGNSSCSTSLTSACQLFTLNLNSPTNSQYAFETSLGLGAALNCSAQLYDVTSNSPVTGSAVYSTTNVITVYRSAKFTLVPGHIYAVQVSATSSAYITDASLIIFPSTPSVSPSLSSVSLANPSGNMLKESYIPLWVYSSGTSSLAGGAGISVGSLGNNFTPKGSSTLNTSYTTVSGHLITLSNNWRPSQSFAFEASVYSSTGSYAMHAALWDMTNNSEVTSSEISTANTSATLIRSSQFNLTPGHSYGATISVPPGSVGYTGYITKAHLVALANS